MPQDDRLKSDYVIPNAVRNLTLLDDGDVCNRVRSLCVPPRDDKRKDASG